jgi:ribonuclease VapC
MISERRTWSGIAAGSNREAATRRGPGDLFSYALARVSGEPLLFKGDDFTKTDIGRLF